MDYVFFGFSALSCGISLLLFFNLKRSDGSFFRIWQYAAVAAAMLLYYLLGLLVFQRFEVLYYLGNILPHGLLLLLTALSLIQKQPSGKAS
ncbi:MAG: hypothetical protein GX112_15300 [Clostridiaceae bacterium]|jgi:predicted exporter|nr:hypothetical protein [Clostridiaceae bacterium]